MSSFQNAPSIEVGSTHQNDILATASLSRRGESPLKIEGDEEEDEDVYFNPFLKETPSQEASSSLSSDIDGLDVDDVDSGGRKSVSVDCNMSISIAGGNENNCAIGDSQHVEGEIVLRGMAYPGEACEKDLGEIVPGKPENATLALTPQPDIGVVCERKSGVSSQPDAIQDGSNKVRESNNTTGSQKLIMDFDDSDAICMRTRARYSLASFTLDELETFLQETDDDDDFQNVDDQEEYRKFLAAVLQGVDGDSKTIQECGNVDDEDEDNDADFQVEIEEALESDLDENIRSKTHKEGYEAAVRRPETRQNRRQKAAAVKQKRVLEEKRPLRPLLPFMRNAPIASFPNLAGNHLMPEPAPHCQSSTAFDGFPNGFTPHQLGQLHCLIHEHVQLLIQVFSICVLDPSRQLIASQIQGLISEMLHQRDHILAWRSMPYPSFCFHPPYVHPSIPDELPKICPTHFTYESPLSSCAQQGFSPVNNKMPLSANVSPSKIIDERNSNGQEGTFWVPYTGYPILSVLDVAPLSFVGKYMDDVSKAKEEHRKRHLDGTSDILFEKEPLFPVRNLPSLSEAYSECVRGPISPATNIGPSSSPSSQPPKKTMAAALVESTKKQSVAPVPKEIVKLVQRFLPLFNPSLYPYKPPPVPVAKRVLFTDAEDELLALGMMEYNTDWKAIQQRLLPCKSKHQIFVRQKNRCSSKAPENPIKAVRRLKTSPLTAEEIARIHEGLRAFKLDWMSIWKFIVPYRDPSLLPRQWRIALGTQKSYKIDPAKKEKRRLYEFKRRHKAAASPGGQTASENEGNQIENDGGETNSGDDCVDNDNEAYVHEAFLSDWRPNTNSLVSSGCPSSNLKKQSQPNVSVPQEHTHLAEQRNTNSCGGSQPQNGQMHEFLAATNSHKMHTFSHLSNVGHCTSYAMELNHRVTKLALKSSKSQSFPQPYRAHKHKHAHLVKLAPDLPPVNLPQSVRVISQSAFKSYRFGSSAKNAAAAGISSAATTESMVARLSHGAESGNNQSTNVRRDRNNALKYDIANLHHQGLGVGGKCVGEGGTDSDLQMHPLLFQAPEDGCFPYYRVNCGTIASTSFGFSPGNQPQLNLSLFHDSQQENRAVICSSEPLKSKEVTSTSGGIDFHPLLQRADDVIGVSANGGRPPQASVDMDSLRDKHANDETHSNIVPSESQANDGQMATSDKPSIADGKANELDLEIHLSSNTSTTKKATGSKNVTRHIQNSSSESAFDPKITMETQDGSPNNDGENYPLAFVQNQMSGDREHVARGSVMSIPSDSISKYSIDNMNDQSLPGIVMEQEELSDSDEETGEYVEFECEEMADSEGEEGSDCEQAANIRNEEATSVVFDKVATNADEDPQQGEPIICGNNVSNFRFPPECSVSQLGSTGQGEDASTAVCLSLKTNSRSWHPIQDSKHVEGRNEDHSADRIIAQSLSKRSCKKRMPTNPSRKSRKRARALTVESSSGK